MSVLREPQVRPVLQQSLGRLAGTGVIPEISGPLKKGATRVGRLLHAEVVSEIPAFSSSANPEVLPDLDQHGAAHIAELGRLLGGGTIGDFEFVRVHARRRAEQRFPLEAVLHAYRCGHKVLSKWMREASRIAVPKTPERVTAAIADFAIEYTNAISTVVAAEYVAHTRVLAEAEGDRRTELLNILLSGFDESDGRVARLLKRAGYREQRQSYCVVLAQSIDPVEMESPARAQRIIEALTRVIGASGIHALVGLRNNLVTAVMSDTRRLSGWTAPQVKLARRLQPLLLELGPAVLIGLSSDQPATAFIPRALREASVALDCANVGERVVQFTDLPLRRLLLHRAADYLQTAAPSRIAGLRQADDKVHGSLTQTLYAYADADMNVHKAAQSLRLHPNTLYARMHRIDELTGLNCRRYHDLTELLLAIDCQKP